MLKKIIAVLILTMAANAQADSVIEAVADLMQDHEIPGVAVQLYVKGKLQSYYAGYTENTKKIPLDAKAAFPLAPLTPLLTDIILAQQVDTANMQLDDSLSDYLPAIPTAYTEATLQNLATYTDDDQWQLSNTGINLLQAALEKSTHKKMDQLYRERIQFPLRMTLRKQVTSIDMQRFLAASIGMPGTPERIFYQIRMTQSAYFKLKNHKQGLGWQIHSLREDKIATLLSAVDVTQVAPLPIIEEYEQPKFNGHSLIDMVGVEDECAIYMAVIPDLQAGIMMAANRAIPREELVSTSREILLRALNLVKDDA